MVDEDVVARPTQRTSSDKRDRAAVTIDSAERTLDMPVPSLVPTNEASRLAVWPTQDNREATIPRELENNDQSPDNTGQSLDSPDSHLAIPNLSPVGDATGSLFSILTPDPGGQTTDNRPIRRRQPKKKKRGRSV